MKKYAFLATVKNFIPKKGSSATTHDKNGIRNKALIPLSGQAPRGVNAISGTVADGMEIANNKIYLFTATREEDYEGQPSYSFDVLAEVNPLDAMTKMSDGLVVLHDSEGAVVEDETFTPET